MKFRKAYEERNEPREGLDCSHEELRTKQQFKDDADINIIVRRFLRGEQLPTRDGAMYGDFSSATDYLTAHQIIQNANEQFNELPAQLRAKFNNDPFHFLEWIGNPENRGEAEAFGLINPRPETPSTPTGVKDGKTDESSQERK